MNSPLVPWRGHYGCLHSLDEQASFDTSTYEQMLVEAQGRNLLDVMVWPPNLAKQTSFGISTMKQMLIKVKERIVSCDWCFHENAGSRLAASNLSQSVDLFN